MKFSSLAALGVGCQNDNFRYSQCWKFHQNGSYVSLCVDGKAQDWSSALAIVTTILRYAIVIIIMHIDGLAQDCSNSSASFPYFLPPAGELIRELEMPKRTVYGSNLPGCLAEGGHRLVAGFSGMECKGIVWDLDTGTLKRKCYFDETLVSDFRCSRWR